MTNTSTESTTGTTSKATTSTSALPDITNTPVTELRAYAKDLYRAVNGQWIDNHVIPADRAIDGAFHALRDDSEKHVRAIVENAPAGSRIDALYKSFMDTDAINNAGLSAIAEDMVAVEGSVDKRELALALARLDRLGVGGPLGFWVEKDSASEDAMLYLVQSGLGLPDEAYYREESHAETLSAYEKHIATMFALATTENGTSISEAADSANAAQKDERAEAQAEEVAQRIVALEKKIAAGHWDVVASRDAVKSYNPTQLADLPTKFPIAEWLAEAGVNRVNDNKIDTVIAMMPSYFTHLGEVWEETDLADLKLWATWRILHSRAPYLSEEFIQENFNFYGRTLQGTTEQRARWKRGVAFVDGAVGHDVGKLYVAEHFPPEHKAQMVELVDYLLAAYRERISALSWMTEETREKALEKLSQFKAKIGYPDQWRDYSGLEVSENLMDNVRAVSAFGHDYEVKKLGKPADRSEWFCNPQMVNAFYNPVVNDITFPAAILRPPFFSPDASPVENFGAIGAVIGHEIGHGFDDQGSHYDGHGNLHEWWSDADREAFEKLTSSLVDQYEGLIPSGLQDSAEELSGVNGRFTLGENIGDLGGLGIAVVAFRRFLADKGPELGIADEPAAYRGMFTQWALVWRTAIRPEFSRQLLAIDPHSPAEFRCNVIASNIDEFHEAFGVREGDGMWLAPEQRVTIW